METDAPSCNASSRKSAASARSWTSQGYAVFSMSDRGWGDSCGGQSQTRVSGSCAHGYNHLMDTRYEVRDAQYLLGLLADEGVVDGQRVGVTGASYGGGISMALAALRDRVMLPDGSYATWTSTGGKAMRIAAAAPVIPAICSARRAATTPRPVRTPART